MINKKKGGLAKRYASSYEKKDGVSTSKGGVINYRNYDGDVTFFNPAEGKHRINIVPYIIKSKNHPLVKKGEAEIGEMDYVLDFYVHRGVGPAEKSVLCLCTVFHANQENQKRSYRYYTLADIVCGSDFLDFFIVFSEVTEHDPSNSIFLSQGLAVSVFCVSI